MRCACVDIGTNTTRLLVAEADGTGLREVAAVREFLRVRPLADGAVPAGTATRLCATVARLVRAAREQGAVRVRVVATAAIRAAPNRDELCRAIAAASGVAVEVLSGEEEAGLAFAGATQTLPSAPEGLVGVVDVGGGSSELVAGTLARGASWSASLALGSGVLTDRHVRFDPPGAHELDAIRAEIDAAIRDVAPPPPEVAFAVGGSATSVRRLAGAELTAEALAGVLQAVTAAPAAESARALGLHVERVRLLPAGLLLLQAAAAAFGGVPLRIAGGGLRGGVVLQELAQDRRA